MAVYNLTNKIPGSGGTITAATWSKDCITNISTSNVPSWITTGGTANKTLTFASGEYTGTTERTATITVNYKASGTDCSNSLKVTQTTGDTPTPPTPPQPWQKSFNYNILVQGTGGGTVNKTLAFKIGVLMSGTFVDEGPLFAQQTTNVTGLEGSWQESAASFKKVDTIQIEGDPTSDAKYITIKASEEGDTEPYSLLPKTEIPLNGGVRAGELIFQTPYTFDKAMGTLYFYFDKT